MVRLLFKGKGWLAAAIVQSPSQYILSHAASPPRTHVLCISICRGLCFYSPLRLHDVIYLHLTGWSFQKPRLLHPPSHRVLYESPVRPVNTASEPQPATSGNAGCWDQFQATLPSQRLRKAICRITTTNFELSNRIQNKVGEEITNSSLDIFCCLLVG